MSKSLFGWHTICTLSKWLFYIDGIPIMLATFALYHEDVAHLPHGSGFHRHSNASSSSASSSSTRITHAPEAAEKPIYPIVLLVLNLISVLLICVHFVISKIFYTLLVIMWICGVMAYRWTAASVFNWPRNIPNICAVTLALVWIVASLAAPKDRNAGDDGGEIAERSMQTIAITTAGDNSSGDQSQSSASSPHSSNRTPVNTPGGGAGGAAALPVSPSGSSNSALLSQSSM